MSTTPPDPPPPWDAPMGDGSTPAPSSWPPPAAAGGYQQPGYGQPASPYGSPGYGPPGFGPWGAQIDHPQGVTIIILGVLSLFFCQVLGPVAWMMGNTAIREIDAAPERYGNRTVVQVGRILGMVSTAIIVLVVLLFVVVFGALALGASSD